MWFSTTDCQVLVAKSSFWDMVLRSFDCIFLAGCVWNGLRSSRCLLGVPIHLPDSSPPLSRFSSSGEPPTSSSWGTFVDLWPVPNFHHLWASIYRLLHWFKVLFNQGKTLSAFFAFWLALPYRGVYSPKKVFMFINFLKEISLGSPMISSLTNPIDSFQYPLDLVSEPSASLKFLTLLSLSFFGLPDNASSVLLPIQLNILIIHD